MGKKHASTPVITRQVVIGELTLMRIDDGPIRIKGEGDVKPEDLTAAMEALDAPVEKATRPCDHDCHHWHWWSTPSYVYTTTSGANTTYTLDMTSGSSVVNGTAAL